MSKPTAVSLFSGIGGIDLAFTREGFNVVAQVEIDPYCRKVLAKHAPQYWPDAIQHEDVKNVGVHNLPAVDVIFGGFPCTDISVAGKQAGITPETRSGLWYEFRRIIGELRPRYVFLENVPAITGNGGTLVIGHLAALGYDAEWCVVPATAVGATHKRERWFCVAYTNAFGRHEPQPVQHSQTNIHWQLPPRLWRWENLIHAAVAGGQDVADASRTGLEGSRNRTIGASSQIASIASRSTALGDADSAEREARRTIGMGETESPKPFARSGQRRPESGMGRVLNGLPGRLDTVRRNSRFPSSPSEVQHLWEAPRTAPKGKYHKDRVKALGNAVVPQVIQPFAAIIYELLQVAE